MRIIILLLLVGTLQAQNYHTFNVPVSVGGATNASSLLTLNSTTQGFLIPRMTTAQRDAIPTPAVGLQIYNTETNTINIFNGTWVALSGGGGIGGTIAAGQVAFGSASNTLSGSSNLIWDNTNNILETNNVRISTGVSSKAGGGSMSIISGARTDIPIYTFNGDNGTGIGRGGISVLTLWAGAERARFLSTGDFGIGLTAPTARLHVRSSGTANTSLSFLTQNSSATNTFSVGDAGRVTIYKDTESSGTQSSARLMVESGDANTNLVLSPKGTGAFIVGPAPDGTTTGGNARGTGAVDLQITRTNANMVASASQSAILSGQNNRVAGQQSVIAGGNTNVVTSSESAISGGAVNTVSGTYAYIGAGYQNTATSEYAVVLAGRQNGAASSHAVVGGGRNNDVENVASYAGIFSGENNTINNGVYGFIGGGEGNSINNPAVGATVSGGIRGRAYLYGQDSYASGMFSVSGDAQTSSLRLRRQVTGFSTRTLSLNGTDTTTNFIPILTATSGTTSRIWNARLQCVAVTNVQGTGGPAEGSVFSETMDITIKRIGTVTSIVNGTPMQSVSVSDVGMSGADFLVDADDTNEALRVRFQPPSIAAADTQIRAVCTVYLTEIGY